MARTVYLTVAFAAFLAVFAVAYAMLRRETGRAGAGRVPLAAGVPLAAVGELVAALGLERAMTLWNDQLALLPWGLSRILGITVYLEIPPSLPAIATIAGGCAVLLGAALTSRTSDRGRPWSLRSCR